MIEHLAEQLVDQNHKLQERLKDWLTLWELHSHTVTKAHQDQNREAARKSYALLRDSFGRSTMESLANIKDRHRELLPLINHLTREMRDHVDYLDKLQVRELLCQLSCGPDSFLPYI